MRGTLLANAQRCKSVVVHLGAEYYDCILLDKFLYLTKNYI